MDFRFIDKLSGLVTSLNDEIFSKAGKGDADMQFMIGFCYFEGIGLEQDFLKSREWFLKAAANGNSEAQFWLGFCCYKGYNVTKSYDEAFQWFKQSAESSDHMAQYYLAKCYLNGEGTEQNYSEAIKLLKSAAHQGNADACILLTDCYKDGIGVECNDDLSNVYNNVALMLWDYFDNTGPREKFLLCEESKHENVEDEDLEDEDSDESPSDFTINDTENFLKAFDIYHEIKDRIRQELKDAGKVRLSTEAIMVLMNLNGAGY